ncbi:TonB-dependent receptor [Ramlibacter sp.]|uniref:TonB-dependent receptor n=1 Tax=Ramlibacter sp. TaxID=1917967 RepID=UPI0017D1C505|nr:TonB-dependent receptor [Ramlibacter sp.]MBA2673030.1 TonB-dependent receptor [Ramlibacter sp.]
MHKTFLGRGALAPALTAALAATLTTFSTGAFAQAGGTLKEVTVTGNPLGVGDLAAPVTQLSGTGLLLRSQTTLGETLNNLPGVSSTYFGPNASRPIVRGLDGDRVRILSNSGVSLDVSNLSYDHAVAADPISIERIEVLRGPGALLYGGNAIGGVVNLIDNRIPRLSVQGVAGKADLGWSSGSRGRQAAVLVEGGNDRIGLHVDAFDRGAGDVRAPVSLPCTRDGTTTFARRICNSASDASGGAVGGSLFFDHGYLGASVSSYSSHYGTVAEDAVTIGMRQDRYALEGEWRDLGGPLRSVKAQLSHSDYSHTEFDAGAPGTVFRNQGNDLRLEARHRKFGALDGVIGLQVENGRFSAAGEEAFAPYSRTRQRALFAYEELGTSWGKLTLGARAERVRVASLGNPDEPRFERGERSFSPASAALGGMWNLSPEWQLSANVAHSERAPKDYELFANGPHLATGAWELGDANLGKEVSNNVDAGLQWKRGHHQFKLNAFQSRFRNYIALQSTGGTHAAGGEDLPEFAYRGVRARFRGLEASGTVRLVDAPSTLDLELRGDLVRATNLDTGEPLPRIAPARIGATLAWAQGAWGARVGFDHNARQNRVPAGELATGGTTLWQAALTYRMKAGPSSLLWYLRLDNATDRLAYSATSILTQTVPGKAPLPGRSVKLGLQASF